MPGIYGTPSPFIFSFNSSREAQLDKGVVGEPSPELENIIKQNVNQALEPTPPAAAAAAAGGSRKKKHRNRSRRKKRK